MCENSKIYHCRRLTLHYKAEPSWDFYRRYFQFITVVAHPARTPSPPIIDVSKLLSLVHGAIGNPAAAANLSSTSSSPPPSSPDPIALPSSAPSIPYPAPPIVEVPLQSDAVALSISHFSRRFPLLQLCRHFQSGVHNRSSQDSLSLGLNQN
ncbi:hypothetical protein M0R45_009131 [Rubus argutus]|uniref:Uncharacterized protein n=1 Tax=Rubus argutus TaxID=59490 RepID=A0AAW1Y542_RUBAR